MFYISVFRFGDDVGSAPWKRETEPDWSTEVRLEEGTLQRSFRYMFETLQSKAGKLDETICRMGELMGEKRGDQQEQQEGGGAPGEPADFMRPHPDPVLCLGRICCDSSDGRLNAHSLVLQGTQDISDGR